jgi:hypothetical protein
MTVNIDTNINLEVQELEVDKRARCWVFTLNGLDVPWADWSSSTVFDFIKELSDRSEIRFICGGIESGEQTNRLHFQGYVEFKKAMRWTSVGRILDSRFTVLKYRSKSKRTDLKRGYTYALKDKPHNLTYISPKKGSRLQARDYALKQGKYVEENNTQMLAPISFGDWVDNGQRLDLEDLACDIQNGKTDIQIFKRDPVAFMRHQRMIRETRSMLISNDWRHVYRDVEVCYISGPTRCGKTSLITQHFGYENIHRITDVEWPWDTYTNQEIIVFEEFRESFGLRDMLAWLEGHPVELPARYFNRQAAFKKVFIISNWPWHKQFQAHREIYPEDYEALMARIHHNIEFVPDGDDYKIIKHSPNDIEPIFRNVSGSIPPSIGGN